MKTLTFKSVTTDQLIKVYTGEEFAAKDFLGNWHRKTLIQCAKHNGYTAQDVIDHPANAGLL